ncbi:Crp/Fnr family transcriptional regulator [Bradyrhizobium arachidis]|uniref:Crp/Fnr family transcriptional regulator n=1 Tax=Bradyrhizobium TaxID=374 RepID=UPI00188AD849|nr:MULTISPECIES: Crp/Fnr family transcriptional regulator [Bradyrhizobium]QOZ54553.1 Crp/Fnr family transcriptional regulator [Bradyrhizobium sp. CCBAU 53338]UVO35196.1 Crp/Fnr family transcriptional regulator [Bradyrhizobium arachidis]
MSLRTPAEDPSLDKLVKRLRLHSALSERDAHAIRELPHRVMEQRVNSYLVREGDRTTECAVLISGFVHRFRVTAEGQRQILSLYVPGDPIDFDHLYFPVADDSLQAARHSTLAYIDQEHLRELMDDSPAISTAVTRALLVDSSIFREWTVNVGRRDAQTRIAHLLCELSLRLQAQGLDFNEVALPLTQAEMADATGLSTVHVNRILKSLKAKKYIQREGGLVMLPDPSALRPIAGFDDRYLHFNSDPVNHERPKN